MGRIIWLASYPKSGNTWLRAFLQNYILDEGRPQDINRLTLLSTGESGASLYRPFMAELDATLSAEAAARLRPAVHRAIAGADPQRVFVKTHNANVDHAGTPLVTAGVTDRAIYLVRDPRDVAVSYAHHLGVGHDALIDLMTDDRAVSGDNVHKVTEFVGSWNRHVESWTAHPAWPTMVLRYEDLLADPADGFGDVIRFLGAEPDPPRLARAIRHSAFDVLAAQERERGFVERPGAAALFFRNGRAGQWRDVLSDRQTRAVEHAQAPQMRRFAYL